MTPNQPQSQFGSTSNDMREFVTEQAEDTLGSAERQLNDALEDIVGVVLGALLMMAARRD